MVATFRVNFTNEFSLLLVREGKYLPQYINGDTVSGKASVTVIDKGDPQVALLKCSLSSDLQHHYYENEEDKDEDNMQKCSTITSLTNHSLLSPVGESVVEYGMRTFTYAFSFPGVDLSVDSYHGYGCSLRFYVTVEAFIHDGDNICDAEVDGTVEKFEFMVLNLQLMPFEPTRPLTITAGFFESRSESTINIKLNLKQNIFGIDGCMVGRINGSLEKVRLISLEIVFGVKETIHGDGDRFPFEIREVVASRGYSLHNLNWRGDKFSGPVDIWLRHLPLTPTYPLVMGAFSVEYCIWMEYTLETFRYNEKDVAVWEKHIVRSPEKPISFFNNRVVLSNDMYFALCC